MNTELFDDAAHELVDVIGRYADKLPEAERIAFTLDITIGALVGFIAHVLSADEYVGDRLGADIRKAIVAELQKVAPPC